MHRYHEALSQIAETGGCLTQEMALGLADESDLETLVAAAGKLRDRGHGNLVSYSRKVFIPLTQLCRDVCHYCTFAHPPRRGKRAYLSVDEVLDIARAGADAGCREALFTLGDKPELRYRVAREELAALGHDSTISYLAEMARLVLQETGLLPHLNPGVMTAGDIEILRGVSVSQGLMLESASPRLCEKGGPHHGSPDKDPAARLETIALAGTAAVPFTTGILIGIGETRRERVESLLALRDLHDRYGHIQEIIVQNFRAKPGTRMADASEPGLAEHLWSIAMARLIFGPAMAIQAPPNLSPGVLLRLLDAGINDWGGVSPVTPDHVNPEAPWPHLDALARETAAGGKLLIQRLGVYPHYVQRPDRWLDPALRTVVLRAVDASGYPREDDWTAGSSNAIPERHADTDMPSPAVQRDGLARLINRAFDGTELSEPQIVRLFEARGSEFNTVCKAADQLRRAVRGDTVTYVVNRNINYTNVCGFRCQFCAFSKGKTSENLRGKPYVLDMAEIARRSSEAWARGATEVCMQGGIHPEYDGTTYLEICQTAKRAAPGIHVHAFSPLEVWQGAKTLELSLSAFLAMLQEAGLGSLPGTAAEILDDEVRAELCADKITTRQWLTVMEQAHELGLPTTATVMYGHIERPEHWARHLLRVRRLQARTGGFTEFVPLPFVHKEAPIYLKGKARRGPTFREAVLMHAVSRLALHPHLTSIQTSWVKMGLDGAEVCLSVGANDLGGSLMNESITRAAGAEHGQEFPPQAMEALIRAMGRVPRQRSTLYGAVTEARRVQSFSAAPLDEIRDRSASGYRKGRVRVQEFEPKGHATQAGVA